MAFFLSHRSIWSNCLLVHKDARAKCKSFHKCSRKKPSSDINLYLGTGFALFSLNLFCCCLVLASWTGNT